jgi:hypothetical protein
MPLGTAYTAVTARVVELAKHQTLRGDCRLVVDATGVGMPVADMLREARPGCDIAAVLITGGQGERFDGKVWHVPKLDLLARLQGLLEQKRLRIARRTSGWARTARESTTTWHWRWRWRCGWEGKGRWVSGGKGCRGFRAGGADAETLSRWVFGCGL